MKCITNGTTKRYEANLSCDYDVHAVEETHTYQYGCEFEFYIDTKVHDFNSTIDSISKEIYVVTNAEILVDTVNLPTDDDKNWSVEVPYFTCFT